MDKLSPHMRKGPPPAPPSQQQQPQPAGDNIKVKPPKTPAERRLVDELRRAGRMRDHALKELHRRNQRLMQALQALRKADMLIGAPPGPPQQPPKQPEPSRIVRPSLEDIRRTGGAGPGRG